MSSARLSFARVFLLAFVAPPAFFGSIASGAPASTAARPAPADWSYALDKDDLEAAWTWTARLSAANASGGCETRVVFHFKDASNYLMLRAAGVPASAAPGAQAISGAKPARRVTLGFWRVSGGKLEPLGDPEATIALPVARTGAAGAIAGAPGKGETAQSDGRLNGQLSIQRTSWRVRALWNGRALVTAYTDFTGGRFGVAARGAARLSAARMQPVGEPPFLRDDFMRAEGPDAPETAGQWRRAAGVWKTSGLLGPRADAAFNPNPFVFRASASSAAAKSDAAAKGQVAAPATAIATVGKWFWSDYTVSAALRPALKDHAAPLTAGVSAYRQSDGACVAGVVDFRRGRARIEVAGRALAVSAPFEAELNQWHRVFLDPGPGTLRLVVDGIERVRVNQSKASAATRALAQGEAALRATLAGGNFVDFDDVRIGPNDAVSDDFATASVGRWQDVAGEWQTQTKLDKAARFSGGRVKLTAGRALTVTGSPEREEGQVEASFVVAHSAAAGSGAAGSGAAGAPSNFGVVFAARDAGNHFVARRRAEKLEIVEFIKGVGKVLAGATARNPAPRAGHAAPESGTAVERRIAVEWREGVITARSGGATTTAAVGTVPLGRVGAWADGPARGVALTSFRALGAAPGWGEDALPDRFTKDRLMKNWASNASLWREDKPGVEGYAGGRDSRPRTVVPRILTGGGLEPTPAEPVSPAEPANAPLGAAGIRWHAGDFFGAAALSLPLPSPPAGKGVQLMIAAAPDAPDAGSRLDIERAGEKIVLRLLEAGRVLQTASLPAPGASGAAGASGELRFARRPVGDDRVSLRVALSGLVLLSQTTTTGTGAGASQHDARTKIGVRAGDTANFDWEKVRAQTSNVVDYAFTGAPVDWSAGKGRWEVAERWTCQPQWGFFGGSYSVNPTLWSRFATRGDFTLEAYLATPMDVTRSERSPIDLNLTVGADGRDLASGYSFLFGARGRTVNRIVRGDEIVAEKLFGAAPAGAGDTHQDWFYIRLERRRTPQGLLFRYSVNNQEIWKYLDPDPLPDALDEARHIAFWTYNGGLSIARVRLWHSGIESRDEAQGTREGGAPLSAFPISHSSSLKNALGEWRVRSEGVATSTADDGQSPLRPAMDGGRSALRVVNPHSGGDWTLFVTQKGFDARAHPLLRFDYRVPADVFINLYARVDGKWREITFSGDPARLIARVRRHVGPGSTSPAMIAAEKLALGRIADVVADDKWHSASFNLLEALQKAGVSTRVEALAFAAPDHDYLHAGLGGNHRGATYWLYDFQAPRAEANAPAVARAP